MDDQVIQLGVQLAEVTVRNTASNVSNRIKGSKAKRNATETINDMDEIINELIADKSELARIAKALEDQLVAQRISNDDIDYVTSNLVPKLEEFIENASDDDASADKIEDSLEVIKPLLSGETLTILQLLGFNFRQAIGEPLTDLLRDYILSVKPNPKLAELELQQSVAAMQISLDPEASARFTAIFRGGA